MDEFGVVSPPLQSRAGIWSGLGGTLKISAADDAKNWPYRWLGATLRNLVNYGRESAVVGTMELSDNRGVLVKAVTAGSVAAVAGVHADAVIVAANNEPVANIADLSSAVLAAKNGFVRLKILTATGYVEVPIAAVNALPTDDSSPGDSDHVGKKKHRDKPPK